MIPTRARNATDRFGRWAAGIRDRTRAPDRTAAFTEFLALLEREPQPIADTERFYEALAQAPLSEADAVDLIERHTAEDDYWRFHRRRFGEQFSLFSHVCERFEVKRILDISTTPFATGVFKRYRPDLDLVTIDLPRKLGGPPIATDPWYEPWGIDRHFAVDLNSADLTTLADDLASGGRFDVVFACEVVEHLRVDFSEVVDLCLSVIRPGGLVIVTTPSFHSEWKLRLITDGKSPQQRFHNYKDSPGGYHYREYTMKELREIVNHAGGTTLAQVYSDALIDDAERLTGEQDYLLRENMVYVFSDTDVSLW
ncbi:MAG: class I SAM-dependent methyltransferase [Ilumatobacteraceae bacterium]